MGTININSLGLSLHQLDRIDEAIDCYDKAIKIESKFAKAFYNKGILTVELLGLSLDK